MAGWEEATAERGWLVLRPLLGQPVGAVGGPCGWMLMMSVAREGCVGPSRVGLCLAMFTVSLVSDPHFPQNGFGRFEES